MPLIVVLVMFSLALVYTRRFVSTSLAAPPASSPAVAVPTALPSATVEPAETEGPSAHAGTAQGSLAVSDPCAFASALPAAVPEGG